jgi:putative PIN family toxin of toxin-antitoxin system
MRVVLDTNIFISGIFWTGNSNKIILAWKKAKFELVSSLSTISEIINVLKDFKIRLPDDIITEWVDLIIKNSIVVEPKEKISIIKDDPTDNMFLESAVAGCAEYIISQNKHLLKVKEFRGIKIFTPEEFLKILN